ncbi:MAG: hypothetical protein WCH76_07585 [Candidatus Riflemargulisbacteria bacterium]
MGVDAIFDMTKMYPYDLTGILIKKTDLCGIVNIHPVRRNAVPYESIDLYANNNRTFRVYVKDSDLNIINVAGCTGMFTFKKTKEDSPLFTKSTSIAAQGAIGSPDQGELLFYILPADTATLDIRQYVFDVRLTLASGATYTVLEGVINLQQPVG